MTITTVSHPAHYWVGRRVRVLSTRRIGPRVWCAVEAADCPGLKSDIQRAHLAARDTLKEDPE